VAPAPTTPSIAPAKQPEGPLEIKWRGQTLEVKLKVQARDVSLLVKHPEANFRADGIFIPSAEPVQVGTSVELRLKFEGHPTEIHLKGQVSKSPLPPTDGMPQGFGVKFFGLPESDRAFIRAYIARAGNR
jgi:uncharacterized protein (TIGR02266 family)